jgi:hypothetical protein
MNEWSKVVPTPSPTLNPGVGVGVGAGAGGLLRVAPNYLYLPKINKLFSFQQRLLQLREINQLASVGVVCQTKQETLNKLVKLFRSFNYQL